MIFRRLSTALQKQDWITVLIEMLIVMFGVLIGLQVNNWNESRKDRDAGRFYLAQIAEDIASDAAFLETNTLNLHREAEHARIIDRYLRGEETGLSDWDMFQIIYYRAGWTPFSPNRVTYDELVNTGQFRLLGEAALRMDIGNYYAGLNDFAPFYDFKSPLRKRVRGKYTPEAQAYLWQNCFPDAHYRSGHGSFTNCPALEDGNNIKQTLAALQQDEALLEAVRYVHSIRLIVMGASKTDIQQARTLSSQIEDFLK